MSSDVLKLDIRAIHSKLELKVKPQPESLILSSNCLIFELEHNTTNKLANKVHEPFKNGDGTVMNSRSR